MKLNKENWDNKEEFIRYLETLKRNDKINWTKNILNTNMDVLAIPASKLKKIAKQILKGNYISFLDLDMFDYYENSYINGKIISHIKDFNIMKKYLDKYSLKIDNWGSTDLLKLQVKNNEKQYFELVNEYIKSDLIFRRRIAIIILFSFIDNCNEIFEIIDSLKAEKEYYVNMAIAWLLCEMFIKNRNETLKYLEKNNLNSFVINKFISKCRDSYRITKEDKDYLLKYKNIL